MTPHFPAAACALGLALAGCSGPTSTAGGGTVETTNGLVKGILFHENGGASARTLVKLFPEEYDPVEDTGGIASDTTDAEGRFVFPEVAAGRYNVLSLHPEDRTSAIRTGIAVDNDTVRVAGLTLRKSGTLLVAPVPDSGNGYLLLPGTGIAIWLDRAGGKTALDPVPPGLLPKLVHVPGGGGMPRILRYRIQVPVGDTNRIENPGWKIAQRVHLNTSATGAGIAAAVTGFPLLIRLNADNFGFDSAAAEGRDLRFTKPDGAVLPFEIERWDAVTRQAEVWVRMDTVRALDSGQSILMYSGKSDAARAGNAGAVFDTADGFQGVWHLGQAGNTSALDATGNHFDGTPYSMTAADAVPGVIGVAARFDGTAAYLRMHGTASGKLNFPAGGSYSVSAWVNLDSAATRPELILGKGHSQYYLRLNYYAPGGHWEFVEYDDADKKQQITDVSAAPAPGWKHLAAVRDGPRQSLYLDGKLVQDSIRLYPYTGNISARDTSYDLSIGRHLQVHSLEDECFLRGRVDEARISSLSYSAEWVKLTYMNQRPDDKLVVVEPFP